MLPPFGGASSYLHLGVCVDVIAFWGVHCNSPFLLLNYSFIIRSASFGPSTGLACGSRRRRGFPTEIAWSALTTSSASQTLPPLPLALALAPLPLQTPLRMEEAKEQVVAEEEGGKMEVEVKEEEEIEVASFPTQ